MRLELTTSWLTVRRYHQLSYEPRFFKCFRVGTSSSLYPFQTHCTFLRSHYTIGGSRHNKSLNPYGTFKTFVERRCTPDCNLRILTLSKVEAATLFSEYRHLTVELKLTMWGDIQTTSKRLHTLSEYAPPANYFTSPLDTKVLSMFVSFIYRQHSVPVSGPGWNRTTGVSNVRGLQPPALAARHTDP